MEQFEKVKQELKNEREENNKKNMEFSEKALLTELNSFENKFFINLGLSGIIYLLILFLTVFLFNDFNSLSLNYPIILIGSSLGVGTFINDKISEIYKRKERYESFSNAKNEFEKLMEETNYKIELEKARNRNIVINSTLNLIGSTESVLDKLPSVCDVKEKYSSKSKEELERNIEEISNLIKERYANLDMLSTKAVLNTKFWKIRSKINKKIDMIIYPLLFGLGTMIFVEFPFLFTLAADSSVIVNSVPILVPFAIGSVGTYLYMLKRNRNYEKVFNYYNSQLKDNALSDTLKFDGVFEEFSEIRSLIEKEIQDISTATIKLNDEKEALETKESKKNMDELHDSTEEMTYYSKHVESLKSIDYSAVLGIDKSVTEQTDSSHTQTKGPVLSRKLDFSKKDN